jgi:hypothetical protein
MFSEHFAADDSKSPESQAVLAQLSSPSDQSIPTFKKSLKSIFKDLYDLTGLAKLKQLFTFIDYVLQKDQRLIIFNLHLSFQTGLEDHLFRQKIAALNIGKDIRLAYVENVVQQFVARESDVLMIDLLHDELSSMAKFFSNMEDTVAIFGELLWIPSIMQRAEEMVRAAGVKQVVYLFGRCTVDEYIQHHLLTDESAETGKWSHALAQDLEFLMLEEEYLTADQGLRLTGNKRDQVMIEVGGSTGREQDEILGSNYDDLLKRSAKGRLKIGWHRREAIYQVCYREEELEEKAPVADNASERQDE